MTMPECPRCGHEDQCSYSNWFDRHPVLGVVGGMFGRVFMGMLFSVYTLGALLMTGSSERRSVPVPRCAAVTSVPASRGV